MTRSVHCLVVSPRTPRDPRAAGLLADAQALGFSSVTGFQCHDLYFVEGDLTESELDYLAAELLSDPIAQSCRWHDPARDGVSGERIVETALRPGVTDPVAEQIVRGAHLLGISGVRRAATGQRFVIRAASALTESELAALARRLLVNPVIHRFALGTVHVVFPEETAASDQVQVFPVREHSEQELMELAQARRTALDLDEMRAIQHYFRSEGRDMTDVELEAIAQTWSEHCSHKTFKARLEVGEWGLGNRDWGLGIRDSNLQSPTSNVHSPISQSAIPNTQSPIPNPKIDSLLKTFLKSATDAIAAPWVLSAFVDNAGIIDFDDEHEISFKVETHNHPSAIEPFGGANTGTGGVIRDILGVSAKPIAATDILCFGPQDARLDELPEGVLHPRRIRSGVVAGVQDYGNKIGIPTVNGAIWYDEGYTANPLVFCGCIGIAPKGKHPRQPLPGDRVIVIGGRTGRDGLRGATFSSMTMDAQTGEVSGASVQIGDPITEKGVIEVVVRARDRGLYNAITDCGAGGLSSAVGELASRSGADVDLARVRLKYAGLAPWEIWLSEAQERMVLAVPAQSLAPLQAFCDIFDVELTDIGAFTDSNRLVVRYAGKTILDLTNQFLFDGMPQRSLAARLPSSREASTEPPHLPTDCASVLIQLLSHPNIASKADVVRIYDHEVQGGTVVKPLTGKEDDGPSDACVLKPIGTRGVRGIVLSNGINPEFGKLDPYRMAVSVVDEAIRNAVAVGADPDRIALLDNFCWGDPLRPETMGELIEAARGCHDAALHYRTPFISGKDSLNNEYLGTDGLRHAIPPTLLISAIGIIDDVSRAVTLDLKRPGNLVYLLGETRSEFGGSHFNLISQSSFGVVPSLPEHAAEMYRSLHRAIRAGLVRACHDLSEGGLAVAVAEMCIAGRLGCELTLRDPKGFRKPFGSEYPQTEPALDLAMSLFSESNGRLLVEIDPKDCAAFEALFKQLPSALMNKIGRVTDSAQLSILERDSVVLSVPVATLCRAWDPSAASE